jgi:hypothetical protein
VASRQLVATLTIPNGALVSNAVSAQQFQGAKSLMIAAPATLPETVTLQSGDFDVQAGTPTVAYGAVQSPPGTDITVGATKRVVLTATPYPNIRLSAGGAVGADRVFQLWAEISN